MAEVGKAVVLVGVGVVALGLMIWLGGDKLGWFGRLPGDIRIEKGNYSFYFPIVTCILISIVLTVVMWLLRR